MRKKTKKRIVRERVACVVCAGVLTVGAVAGFATVNRKARDFEARVEASKAAAVQTVTIKAKPAPTATPAPVLYDVPLSADLQLHIFAECEKRGVDETIVLAMIERESRFTEDAIGDNGNSYGYMQIQPRWWYGKMETLGCTDLLDGKQNVTVGIDILADLLEANGGDYAKALVCYNQGSYKGTVTKYAQAVLAGAEELRGETA